METHSFALEETNPITLFETVQDTPYALLLDSADRNHPNAKNSYIYFAPIQTIETNFNDLETTLKLQKLYAAGFFGYDLVHTLETLPKQTKNNLNTPPLAIGLYDFQIHINHTKNTATCTIIAASKTAAEKRKNQILKTLTQTKPSTQKTTKIKNWSSDVTPETYKTNIQKIINYILEGDIFQANLSQQFSASIPKTFCPWKHYKHLRTINPAPFASYFNTGKTIISSASPERFLTLKNGEVETRPIKGTLPTSMNKSILENSEKDRAENIMIVDLLRNDLSKICAANSIHVTELCKLETFASLYHLVSTITAKLKPDYTALDLLKACFPGGSITGAPKIRAMEIIEELETYTRGPYCGSLGHITSAGDMDTNILIRTLIYNKNTAHFNVGGGITAASNPEAEHQETLDKAAAIFKSFEAQS